MQIYNSAFTPVSKAVSKAISKRYQNGIKTVSKWYQMVLCSLARVRTAFPLTIAAAEGACGQALILKAGLHQAAHPTLA